jgi:hypothetical protein
MEASPDVIEARVDGSVLPSAEVLGGEPTPLRVAPTMPRLRPRQRALPAALERYRPALVAYLGTRLLLLVVLVLDAALRNHSLTHEIGNWDGWWYGQLAAHGYPVHASHVQTTLGFFPLFSILMWLVRPLAFGSYIAAGMVLSLIGGLITAVIVQRLATDWWDEAAGKRAAVIFCLFPGSVVFSMAYSEGLLLPLAAGCLLALQHRRWVLAGLLAGLATAVEPDAAALIVVCGVAALLELRRRGWNLRAARRSLWAPALSVSGLGAFAIFLWAWTGTPLATFQAQHYGWQEKTDPIALVHLARRLGDQISFTHFNHPTINLNYVVGIGGALFLFVGLALLFKQRGRIPVEAMLWTLGISFLAITSEYVPPNPRLLITAFPAVIVFARYLERRRGFVAFAIANGVLLVALSALTFVGVTLRP